jgi:hypothetical protein
MAIHTLSRAQAFTVQHDLWIIPDKKNLPLFSKIDWYLNFQLTRASEHKRQALPPQLVSISSENSLPDFSVISAKEAPLMVLAEMGLPTKTLIEISAREKMQTWVTDIYKTWKDLGQPSLRVFLPNDLKSDDFSKLWPGSSEDELSIVPA